MKTVAITNESTVCTDAEIQAFVPDLQTQVTRDFCPIWGVDAQLAFIAKGQTPPSDAWGLHVLDNSDQAGALGYHDLNGGVPRGFVFAASDKQAGNSVSVTISHELLELLADPYIEATALYQTRSGWRSAGMLLALEVADACEADQFGYTVGKTLVSDFVTPAWFGSPLPPAGKYDLLGHITAPYQILQGGYIGALQLRGIGQWTQVTGQMENPQSVWQCHQMQDGRLVPFEPPIGSRRHRRGKLHVERPTSMFNALGVVRNDIDQLIGHADASLAKVDNATNWMADILADAAKGKVALHVALELEPKPGFSAWLESR